MTKRKAAPVPVYALGHSAGQMHYDLSEAVDSARVGGYKLFRLTVLAIWEARQLSMAEAIHFQAKAEYACRSVGLVLSRPR